jgi:hypothetical protein
MYIQYNTVFIIPQTIKIAISMASIVFETICDKSCVMCYSDIKPNRNSIVHGTGILTNPSAFLCR